MDDAPRDAFLVRGANDPAAEVADVRMDRNIRAFLPEQAPERSLVSEHLPGVLQAVDPGSKVAEVRLVGTASFMHQEVHPDTSPIEVGKELDGPGFCAASTEVPENMEDPNGFRHALAAFSFVN